MPRTIKDRALAGISGLEDLVETQVRLEGPCDAFRVKGDDGEVGAGWLVRGAAPWFPVA